MLSRASRRFPTGPWVLLLLVLTVNLRSEPLAVGAQVPDVAVFSAEGERVLLRRLASEGPMAVVFYRGGWCPYCVRHLADLMSVAGGLRDAGVRLIAVSPDRPGRLPATRDKARAGFDLYSDSGADAMRAFGIAFELPRETVAEYKTRYGIDVEADSGSTHHLLPHPAVFLVDAAGFIRFAHVNPDYRQRLEPAALLKAAQGLGRAPAQTPSAAASSATRAP